LGGNPIFLKSGVVMQKFIFMLILNLVCTNAIAEWMLVSSDEIKTTYADQASIKRDGNIIAMSGMFDFKITHTTEANKIYNSLKFRDEFNCDEKQQRNLEITVLEEKMGEGEVISNYSEPGKWQVVVGVGESLWKVACGVNK